MRKFLVPCNQIGGFLSLLDPGECALVTYQGPQNNYLVELSTDIGIIVADGVVEVK